MERGKRCLHVLKRRILKYSFICEYLRLCSQVSFPEKYMLTCKIHTIAIVARVLVTIQKINEARPFFFDGSLFVFFGSKSSDGFSLSSNSNFSTRS